MLRDKRFASMERFSMSLCDFHKYEEQLHQAKAGYERVWNGQRTHMNAKGSALVADMLEYALWRAVSSSIESKCPLRSIPPPVDMPLQPNETVHVDFTTPNYGTFHGVRLRCHGMSEAVAFESFALATNESKRGCFKTGCDKWGDHGSCIGIPPSQIKNCRRWHSVHGQG